MDRAIAERQEAEELSSLAEELDRRRAELERLDLDVLRAERETADVAARRGAAVRAVAEARADAYLSPSLESTAAIARQESLIGELDARAAELVEVLETLQGRVARQGAELAEVRGWRDEILERQSDRAEQAELARLRGVAAERWEAAHAVQAGFVLELGRGLAEALAAVGAAEAADKAAGGVGRYAADGWMLQTDPTSEVVQLYTLRLLAALEGVLKVGGDRGQTGALAMHATIYSLLHFELPWRQSPDPAWLEAALRKSSALEEVA